MNSLDKKYTDLLQDILDNGVTKQDRTGTGTLSVFGRQIRHKMSEGFPLLTTKKMYFKGIVTELLWFLRGDTNIKYLVDNDCHIWDGDCYQAYLKKYKEDNKPGRVYYTDPLSYKPYPQEEFIDKIKTDDEFAKTWGELGPIYGKQWRSWGGFNKVPSGWNHGTVTNYKYIPKNDQIANSLNLLKTDPDSRRNKVSAWNVGEMDQMTLPPCHTDFQFYTRELSEGERGLLLQPYGLDPLTKEGRDRVWKENNLPTRAISLMWNQRSVDTFLGLPFNIASYGLLLEIIAQAVNMVPDELIGNLGDTHLYLNHVEQAKEQIGRELTIEERGSLYRKQQNLSNDVELVGSDRDAHRVFDDYGITKRTREPYSLPTLNINTEFWPTESGECGIGSIDAVKVFEPFKDDNFCKCLLEDDIQLGNYQSHPSIKAPLSN